MYCDLFHLGAAVEVTLKKTDTVSIQSTLDAIWALRNDKDLAAFGTEGRVEIHEMGATFGHVDISVHVQTKLESVNGVHPTWRIAKFVEKVYNVANVERTTTRIFIHDPNHDVRLKS